MSQWIKALERLRLTVFKIIGIKRHLNFAIERVSFLAEASNKNSGWGRDK